MKAFLLYIIVFFSFCILKSQDTLKIYFEINERILTDDHKSILAKGVRSRQNIELKDFLVYGYADFLGSDTYNKKLSDDRANVTRDFLLELGLKKYQFTEVKGFGKQIAGNNDSLGYPENRRVDIILKDPMTKDSVITFRRLQNVNLDSLDLTGINVGDNVVIGNLNFQGGRHFLLEKSKPVLNQLLAVMQNNPTLEIEIQGHICCEKNNFDGYDMDAGDKYLSHNRAKYIYDFLVKEGIEANRMTYKGYGVSKPLVKYEQTEADRVKNRRVEIKITKK